MGLWDAIWGYVSVDENLKLMVLYLTIKQKLQVLGGEITQDYFQNGLKEKVFLMLTETYKV